jgi:hypothetical protein
VKVKVIKIGGHIPQAEDVEEKLRAWLLDNPNAEIEHVVQVRWRTALGVILQQHYWSRSSTATEITYATTPRGIGGTSTASTAARMSVP